MASDTPIRRLGMVGAMENVTTQNPPPANLPDFLRRCRPLTTSDFPNPVGKIGDGIRAIIDMLFRRPFLSYGGFSLDPCFVF